MSLIGNFIRKKISAPPRAAPRIDDNLPLRLKIGSLVSIERTPFDLAKQAGLLVDKPERQQIAAFGKISYQGLTIYRFYFEDGMHMLQIALDGAGKMADDPFLYKLLPEIRPQSKEEWSQWLADPDNPNDTGLIGFNKFDLLDRSVSPAVILASYARMWPNDSGVPPQVPLETFDEKLWREPYEDHYTRIRHSVMLYGRVPPNPKAFPPGIEVPDEWLQLSASEYAADSVVQMYVGIPVPVGAISLVLS